MKPLGEEIDYQLYKQEQKINSALGGTPIPIVFIKVKVILPYPNN